MNKFMQIAIKEANNGLKNKSGGPFGAVIVKNKKVIAKAHNSVLKSNDPTAHAEINAIRIASKKLKRFDLNDCKIYTTCQPCPMCLSAIYWANIKEIYYGATANDAERIGFIDKKIYDILKGKSKTEINIKKINRKECLILMKKFDLDPDKKLY